MIAALDLLAGMPGRRIAVLGEMLELGDGHEEGHERVGAAAAGVVDRLIVVGDGAAGIAAARATRGSPRTRSSRRRTVRRRWRRWRATLATATSSSSRPRAASSSTCSSTDLVAALEARPR